MTSSIKKEIAKAKKLDRGMVAYAQKTRDHLSVSFQEAIRQMNIQADRVAADLDCSIAFVKMWTEGELAKGR